MCIFLLLQIFDNQGNQLYFAAEKSSFLERCCLKANRGFTINLLEANGANIATFQRAAQARAR